MDNKFIYMNSDEEVPDIVRTKCDNAYNTVLTGKVNHKKAGKRITIVKYCVSLAACVAVIFSAAKAFPVMAANIKALQNVYEFFTGNNFYAKYPEYRNDVTEYSLLNTDDASESTHENGLKIQSIYFNGQYISFTCTFTTDNAEINSCTNLIADQSLKLNGNELSKYMTVELYNTGNGFVGTSYADASSDKMTGSNTIEINLTNFKATDNNTMILDDQDKSMVVYSPKETEIKDLVFNYKTEIKADDNLVKEYSVNETHDDITLNKITVSPFATTVDITGLKGNETLMVYDNNGNRYEGNSLTDTLNSFEAPLTDAQSIDIKVIDLDKNDMPVICRFNVPIEKGYRKSVPVNAMNYDESKITYIPPKDSEEVRNIKDSIQKEKAEKAKIIPVGETVSMDDNAYTIKITGSQIITDYDKDSLNEMGLYQLQNGADKNYKLVVVEYELTAASDCEIYFNGLQFYTRDMKEFECNEPAYFSVSDYEGKSAYRYDFKAGISRTIKVGTLVPQSMLDKGVCVYSSGYTGTETNNFSNIKLMEIE